MKPTVPLTPPKAIPSFEASRKKSPGTVLNKASSRKSGGEDLLIDFSTPAPTTTTGTIAGSENLADPFSPLRGKSPGGAKVPLPEGENEEAAAARQREAEEKRNEAKKAILEQREARRKSMANRRVSFAPEATLHTWNVVELAEDSTTSSSSNSTRRQSSITTAQSPVPDVVSSDPPSTPPAQVEEPLVKASPAHQRDLHQKKRRRRSSGIPPMNFNNPDDEADLSSSPFSGSSAAGESSPVAVDESINSDDDSDDDNDTAMSIDDITAQSGMSVDSSTGSSLEERLAAAANHAGTRGIGYDENGEDESMEVATGTVTNAFKPWANQSNGVTHDLQDQENINPFSPAFKAQLVAKGKETATQEDEGTQEMSMDVTAAVGGIVPQTKQSPSKGRRKSVAFSRRRSSVARRRSSGDASVIEEDETMELTTMGGGIIQHSPGSPFVTDDPVDEDEEMTMEFTNVVGGVLSKQVAQEVPASARRESLESTGLESASMDETMEMTAAIGGILAPIEEQTEPITEDGDTQVMDVTSAMGAILPSDLNTTSKTRARQLMEHETDSGQLDSSPFQERTAPVSPHMLKSALPDHVSTSVASETGSPSLAMKPRLSGRRTPATRQSTTPKSAPAGTPVKAASTKIATPTKQVTPQASRPETPEKTPIMSNVTFYRSASPKKLFKAEMKAKSSPASAQKPEKKGLFSQDAETGAHTPSIVLAPKPHQHLRRRSSGLGIDKDGLGSPRISNILDRRGSIGENAQLFVPDPIASRGVRFDDPKAIEEQIDAEREEDVRRESGRFVMEQEADGQQDDENATLNLKEMIQSMTPKKNKLKGRKSLHVGAAKGLLGKRPVELDIEEDEAESTPKRLKAIEIQTSPVKKIHLPAPPSRAETTGRVTRAKRRSLEETTGNITPSLRKSTIKADAGAESPQQQGRFKDPSIDPTAARPTSFEDKLDNVVGALDAEVVQVQQAGAQQVVEEKIHLQDFLNMTNIHFMELNTTKRRQTIAPTMLSTGATAKDGKQASLTECVVAATTTLPLLELYQHACRELKSYISSGRRIIRSIEQETFEEQPPLFREYLDARPDVRMVMDNQFRNGKVNARLQSKAGWYAWRSQLVDGLRGGLENIKAGMAADASQIASQEAMLEKVLPGLEQRQVELEEEEQMLQKRKFELESEDHEALRAARLRLMRLESELAHKNDAYEQLQREIQDKETTLSDAAELKSEFQAQIEEAERVQEECRGVSLKDVKVWKTKVEEIEHTSGWKIISAEEDEDYSEANGPALTMLYKDSLRLFFYPGAFQVNPQENRRRSKPRASTTPSSAPISLTYSPPLDDDYSTTPDLPTEKRFTLQFLRSQLHALSARPKGTITPLTLLNLVKNGWDLTAKITEEIRLLSIMGVTSVAILGDETLGMKTTLLLPSGKGRVDVSFNTHVSTNGADQNKIGVSVDVQTIYGVVTGLLEKKKDKVLEALAKEIEGKNVGMGSWVGAVRGFEEWVGLQKGSASAGVVNGGSAIPTPGKGKTPRRK